MLTTSHRKNVTMLRNGYTSLGFGLNFRYDLSDDAYRILVGKPEGRRPLERPRHRWEDNIEMDHRKSGMGGMEWIVLAQDRDRWRSLVNVVMNLRIL